MCSPEPWSTATAWATAASSPPGDVQWMTAGSGIIHQEMPKGDADGTDARVPAVGEPAVVAQDDGAALPGGEGGRHPGGQGRRRHAGPRRLRGVPGERRPGQRTSPPIRSISMCRCRRAERRPFLSDATRHAFAYVFAGEGKFCNASGPLAVPTKGSAGPTRRLPGTPRTVRSSSLTAATKLRCRRGMTASVSCSFRASRSRSPSPGTARSS